MASEIRLTSEQLRAKKEMLQQLNRKFLDVVNSLEATVKTLDGSWEGETHDAFYSAFQNDRAQMNNFHQAIEQFSAALDQILAKYQAAENSNISIAQSRNY